MSIFGQYTSGGIDDKNHLRLSPYILTGYPFSIAAWIRPMAPSQSLDTVITLTGPGSTTNVIRFGVDANRAFLRVNGSANIAYSSAFVNRSSWSHIAAVGTNATLREAFANGGGKGTNTNNTTCSNTSDAALLGANNSDAGYAGNAAVITVWDTALTDYDIKLLAYGSNPVYVKRANIVWHSTLFAGKAEVSPKPAISRKLYSLKKPYADSKFNSEPYEPTKPALYANTLRPFFMPYWVPPVYATGEFFQFFDV